MEKKIDIRLESVTITFPTSSHISQCIREAISFSALEGCEVQWVHNDIEVKLDARPLVEETHIEYLKNVPK